MRCFFSNVFITSDFSVLQSYDCMLAFARI
nr:MAG TPA: hypothetical protein [Caudoviricetes sp.]